MHIVFSVISPPFHCSPFFDSQVNLIMFPVTIVNRFLKRQTPQVPLPPDIDEEYDSRSESWVMVSNSRSTVTRTPAKPTSNMACQTSSFSETTNHRPRSRVPDNLYDERDALPPPCFGPKAKLPRLHYGGLPKPPLHCFTSHKPPTNSPLSAVPFKLLKASAKSLPSPSSFHHPTQKLSSTEDREKADSTRAKDHLRDIFFEIGFASKLYCEIYESAFINQHLDRIADSLGTGGLLMYIQVWNHWACWCSFHSQNPAEAPLSLVLDYLHASDHMKKHKSSTPSRTRMTTHIKALRWIALKLDLPILQHLQCQTVSDFLKSKTRIPFERSEASPIPLAVLAAWESRILSQDAPPAEIITLGCFLVATMASLRFRDLLRTKPQSLNFHGFILRGISWRTKTSVSGQPWGVCCLGISTRPSKEHWVTKFLQVIESGLELSRAHWGQNWEPDFLLPAWTDTIPFSSPCSYHHGLALIRYYAQCLWLPKPILSPEQARDLSTHSMKSTLLAAAGQLNLNVEQRAKQGHHKQSVQLYSRDDVWPSLFLQRDILTDVSIGWRPLTSQARGAKQPLPEPDFHSPPITAEDLRLVQMKASSFPHSNVKSMTHIDSPPTSPTGLKEDDLSSSDSESSSSSDDEASIQPTKKSILVINNKSHVVHSASQTNPGSSKRACLSIKDLTYEVNCGSSMTGAPIDIITSIPPGARLCQRKACLLAMDHILS